MTEARSLTIEQMIARNRRDLAWCSRMVRENDAEAQRLAERLDELTRRRAQLLTGVIRD